MPVFRSTPSGDSSASACTRSGSPSSSCANATGYTPRSSSARRRPPPGRAAGAPGRPGRRGRSRRGPSAPRRSPPPRPPPPGAARRAAVRPHGLHQEDPALPGQGDQLLRLPRVQGERLLAQHRLPASRHSPAAARVRRVRRGDVHHVDVAVLRQLGPRPVRPWGSLNRSAKPFAPSSVRDATATTSASSGMPSRSCVNDAAMPPVASTPQRIFRSTPAPSALGFNHSGRAESIGRAHPPEQETRPHAGERPEHAGTATDGHTGTHTGGADRRPRAPTARRRPRGPAARGLRVPAPRRSPPGRPPRHPRPRRSHRPAAAVHGHVPPGPARGHPVPARARRHRPAHPDRLPRRHGRGAARRRPHERPVGTPPPAARRACSCTWRPPRSARSPPPRACSSASACSRDSPGPPASSSPAPWSATCTTAWRWPASSPRSC